VTFSRGIEKISTSRFIKEIAKGNLSPSAIDRLKGLVSNPKEVKRLGHGGEQIADLVLHPQHGLAVRKIPILDSTHPKHLMDSLSAEKERVDLWKHTKKITGGKGDFAHLLSRVAGKPVSYYEYSKPHAKEMHSRIDTLYKQKHKAFEDLENKRWPAEGDRIDFDEASHRKYVRADKHRSRVRAMFQTQPKLSPETEQHLEKLKAKYPGLHDMRHANFIGGKIVDLSPHMRSHTRYMDQQWKLPMNSSTNYSRKKFLGNK